MLEGSEIIKLASRNPGSFQPVEAAAARLLARPILQEYDAFPSSGSRFGCQAGPLLNCHFHEPSKPSTEQFGKERKSGRAPEMFVESRRTEMWLKAFNNGHDLICGYIFDHSAKMLCPWPKYFNAIDFFNLPKAKM